MNMPEVYDPMDGDEEGVKRPAQECNCSMAIKLNGDGCAVCNPERAADLVEIISMGPVGIYRNDPATLTYGFKWLTDRPQKTGMTYYSADQLATLQAKLEQAEKDKAGLLDVLKDMRNNSPNGHTYVDCCKEIAKYEGKK